MLTEEENQINPNHDLEFKILFYRKPEDMIHMIFLSNHEIIFFNLVVIIRIK